jgi:hypothetical protein
MKIVRLKFLKPSIFKTFQKRANEPFTVSISVIIVSTPTSVFKKVLGVIIAGWINRVTP